METLLQRIVALPIGQKLVCGVFGILIIHALFRLLERILPRHFREQDARYRARKFVVYAGYAVAILFVTILFEDRLGRISFTLGVASAGLVVALQDVIASCAGTVNPPRLMFAVTVLDAVLIAVTLLPRTIVPKL